MTLNAEDKIAIQELSAAYANAMDAGDIAGWLETWADDGVWEGGAGRYEGKERLAQLLPDLGNRIIGKRHIMSNFVNEGDGNEARQTCYLLIIDRSKVSLPGSAVYVDTLQKKDGQWFFVQRKVQIDQVPT
jgi:ketosteroid isomerase-like protein